MQVQDICQCIKLELFESLTGVVAIPQNNTHNEESRKLCLNAQVDLINQQIMSLDPNNNIVLSP